MPDITTDELAERIAPFVDLKINSSRRTAAIDIIGKSERYDADVRGITAEGVEVFWIRGIELERWEDISSIRTATYGADGFRNHERDFRHVGVRRAA